MKDSYVRTQLEITEFQQEDVITTSTPDPVVEPPKDSYMLPIR